MSKVTREVCRSDEQRGERSGRSADAARQASRPLAVVPAVTRQTLDHLRRSTGR